MNMIFDQEPTIVGGIQDIDAGRTQALPVAGATQMGVSLECPVCRARNLPTEAYCSECGFLLSSTPGEEIEAPAAPPASLTDTRTKQTFPLEKGMYSVGRENADILLSDPSVSRQHAQVEVRGADALVTDLGSTNGTTVAGIRLAANASAPLSGEQEVRFGNCVLLFHIVAAAEGDGNPEAEAAPAIAAEETAGAEADLSDQPAVQVEPSEEVASGEETASEPADPAVEDKPAAFGPEQASGEESSAEAYLLETSPGGARHSISADGATIGRRPGNDIVLANAYVSSSHAQVSVQDGVYSLMDVGSTNGTTLNGTKITPNTPQPLSPGDEIGFGPITLVFQTGAGESGR